MSNSQKGDNRVTIKIDPESKEMIEFVRDTEGLRSLSAAIKVGMRAAYPNIDQAIAERKKNTQQELNRARGEMD